MKKINFYLILFFSLGLLIILSYHNFFVSKIKKGITYLSASQAIATTDQYNCTDSDGGKYYYIKGSIGGGTPDYCDSTTGQLVEYYCDGSNGGSSSVFYTCPNGCQDGACIPQSGTDLEITDVRTGDFWPYGLLINVCVHGSKSINDLEKEIIGLNGFPYNIVVYDLKGTSSDDAENAGGGIEDMKNSGCQEFGVTVETEQQPAFDQTGRVAIVLDPQNLIKETNENNNVYPYLSTERGCADSDGGKDYYEKGETYGRYNPVDSSIGKLEDRCETPRQDFPYNLTEFSCDYSGGVLVAYPTAFYCPNGCKDGACLEPSDQSCTDSDGGKNYYMKGSTSGFTKCTNQANCMTSTTVQDICGKDANVGGTPQTVNSLQEFSCDGNYRYVDFYECPNGCQDGACLGSSDQACTDSDGGKDYYTKGTVTEINQYTKWQPNIYPDMCVSDTPLGNLAEAVCEKRADGYYYGSQTYYTCPNGCKDGACLELSDQSCTDSDGDNIYKKGTVKGYALNGMYPTRIETSEDKCQDAYSLYEHICTYNELTKRKEATYKTVYCPGGCQDGACQSCTDSDGGIDYYTKGEVNFENGVVTDSCLNVDSIMGPSVPEGIYVGEAFCYNKYPDKGVNLVDGIIGASLYKCPNGCKDGACLNSSTLSENQVDLYLFYGEGCPHCAKAKPFLEGLKSRYPSLKIYEYEVWQDAVNQQLFQKMAEAYNEQPQGVPTVFIGDKVIVGYDESMDDQYIQAIDYCLKNNCPSPGEKLNGATNTQTFDMNNRLKGKIILKVQSKGEAYYINPTKLTMHSLGRPNDAFQVMREQGVGITNSNLAKISVGLSNLSGTDTDKDGLPDIFEDAIGTNKNKADTDGDGYNDKDELANGYSPVIKSAKLSSDNNFTNTQKGKIFLQVEGKGEAWYVNPTDGKRYFLGRPEDAFNVMRNLGLGVSNSDFDKLK